MLATTDFSQFEFSMHRKCFLYVEDVIENALENAKTQSWKHLRLLRDLLSQNST